MIAYNIKGKLDKSKTGVSIGEHMRGYVGTFIYVKMEDSKQPRVEYLALFDNKKLEKNHAKREKHSKENWDINSS